MPKIVKNGKEYTSTSNKASNVAYNNKKSGLDSVNVQNAIDELKEKCFQSVSDGKTLVASAITDKGIDTASDATFETMANNIGAIPKGKCISLGNGKTFNVQTVCDENGIDWRTLNDSNFIVGVKNCNAGKTSEVAYGNVKYYGQTSGFSISHSYDATSGVLTISGATQDIFVTYDTNTTKRGLSTQTLTAFAYLVYTG